MNAHNDSQPKRKFKSEKEVKEKRKSGRPRKRHTSDAKRKSADTSSPEVALFESPPKEADLFDLESSSSEVCTEEERELYLGRLLTQWTVPGSGASCQLPFPSTLQGNEKEAYSRRWQRVFGRR